MKHILKTAFLFVTLMSVSASAATVCAPVAPKEWTGHIDFLHPGQSAAVTYFEESGCDWGGFEQLNGTDGLVLDVEGQSGPGDILATNGAATLFIVVANGYFLDANCTKVAQSDFHLTTSNAASPTGYALTIPEGAKWMVFSSTETNFANDQNVIVHSHGKDCPIKKKKKKR
jgi:opacity protein-like surface antigen